jgi:hypothetical protein
MSIGLLGQKLSLIRYGFADVLLAWTEMLGLGSHTYTVTIPCELTSSFITGCNVPFSAYRRAV